MIKVWGKTVCSRSWCGGEFVDFELHIKIIHAGLFNVNFSISTFLKIISLVKERACEKASRALPGKT